MSFSAAPEGTPQDSVMEWRAAEFYRTEGASLTCTLCPHACSLGDGDRGRCYVRRRRGDALETATFATSVLHVQAIERKPLYHFRPGSRVVTVAAPGCSFACSYCQNFRLSQFGRSPEAAWSARPLEPDELVAAAVAEGAAIAFSYAEPVLAAELTLALAPLAQRAGIDIVWKTNGFVTTEAARRLAPALAALNIDLKAADETAHRKLTGAPLGPILDAIEEWVSAGVWIEISTPLIPGVNTDDASLRTMAKRVYACGPATPWHLLRFHPDYRLVRVSPTHPDLLARAAGIANEVGLEHVYVERAIGQAGRDTRCPSCQATVVRRDIWALAENRVVAGRCPDCEVPIAGRWVKESP
jgi:pyruvate formate lyase activating enzyme